MPWPIQLRPLYTFLIVYFHSPPKGNCCVGFHLCHSHPHQASLYAYICRIFSCVSHKLYHIVYFILLLVSFTHFVIFTGVESFLPPYDSSLYGSITIALSTFSLGELLVCLSFSLSPLSSWIIIYSAVLNIPVYVSWTHVEKFF